MAKVKVTLTRSPISCPKDQRRTVEGLGLRKMNQSKIHTANLPILGMIRKVSHLVTVEEVPDEAKA